MAYLEYGFGGSGTAVGTRGVREGDDARRVHLVEADMQADGACHQKVVMMAVDSAVSAVRLALVCEVFVETPDVALGVQAFAYDFHECGYNHRLGGDICVEAVFARKSLAYLVL